MNYLAHIFLSGSNRQLQVGNFIGDFVKGNQVNNFPDEIRKGIILHRRIDCFTDSHEVVRETISLLRPHFGRYSGIVVDMYFDHLLAACFEKYSEDQSLKRFAANFYFSVIRYYTQLPSRVKGFIWHFISTNRLYRYSSLEGLNESLTIMSNFKTPAINPEYAIDILKCNYEELTNRFHMFFPDLLNHVTNSEISLDNK